MGYFLNLGNIIDLWTVEELVYCHQSQQYYRSIESGRIIGVLLTVTADMLNQINTEL